jgi:hypothetical protein
VYLLKCTSTHEYSIYIILVIRGRPYKRDKWKIFDQELHLKGIRTTINRQEVFQQIHTRTTKFTQSERQTSKWTDSEKKRLCFIRRLKENGIRKRLCPMTPLCLIMSANWKISRTLVPSEFRRTQTLHNKRHVKQRKLTEFNRRPFPKLSLVLGYT